MLDQAIPKRWQISYTDYNGSTTQRIIQPMWAFQRDSNNYVKGYCELRHDIRTFMLSRINPPLIDADTQQPFSISAELAEQTLPTIDDTFESTAQREYSPTRSYFSLFDTYRLKLPLAVNPPASYSQQRLEIDLKRFGFDDDGALYLKAFCPIHNMEHSFTASELSNIVDRETGEYITDLGQYLKDRYAMTPEGIEADLLRNYPEIVKVMFYLIKADGKIQAAEKDIFLNMMQTLTNNKTISFEGIERLLKRHPLVATGSFQYAVRCLKSQPRGYRKLIVSSVEQLYAKRKTLVDLETKALAYIQKTLQDQ